MLYMLGAVNVAAVLLMLFMLFVIIRQQPSRAQTAFILYDVFSIVYVVGIHLELIRSDTVGEALSGLCVQYVGQAGFLMALVWFIAEFAHIKIPRRLYIMQGVLEAVVVAGVFTAEHHTLFYTSMKILTDGMYPRIQVTDGILWYLHFAYVYIIILAIMVLCARQYRREAHTQRIRILYIAVGIAALAAELTLKILGVFGSYNPIVCALVFTMYCMMAAVVKHDYFYSFHAAVDNAFNHGEEGLVILDSAKRVRFINHKMEGLFPDIREGEIFHEPEEIVEVQENGSRTFQRGDVTYELRVEDIIENGEQSGYMLWFIDQTESLRIMQQLQEANEAKSRFLMRVSHELRTPMNTILGMNEMIIRESNEAHIKEHAMEVASAGEDMLILIGEVLDASRLESGHMELEKKAFWVEDVLGKAEKRMRPQAEKKGLAFRVDAEEALLDRRKAFYGDDARILQIVTNLLSNAIKYTDTGSVQLKAEKAGSQLCFSVTDTGIGIPEEEQDRIFESFERGSSAKKSRKDGIGLGLAIVKQLTESMEGTVTVSSVSGAGSIFRVMLPWVRADGMSTEKNGTYSQEAPDLHTKMILAVDDNAKNLMVLVHLLRRTQVGLETETDGLQAVGACARKTYDLILLDHMMPDMDGMAVLRKIREDVQGRNHDTPVIVLTANAAQGAAEMYRAAGFAGYLTKPIDPHSLETVLMQHLGVVRRASADTQGQKDGDQGLEDRSRGRKDGDQGLEDRSQGPGNGIRARMDHLESQGILVDDGLQYADGDIEFYQELLDVFADEQEERRKKLDKAYAGLYSQADEKAWELFTCQAHKLKGEAQGIGAAGLGELFYRLELAGREKDLSGIGTAYPLVREEWQRIIEAIAGSAL